jgi:hypothetical protein
LLEKSNPLKRKLAILKLANIKLSSETKTIFEAVWKTEGLINPIFKQLAEAGYDYETHPEVYQYFYEQITTHKTLSRIDIKLFNQLIKHAQQTGLSDTTSDEIQCLIKDVTTSHLTEGPLNKTKSTYELERILASITEAEITEINMHYDAFEGYVIQIKDSPEISINLLLKEVNLSHLHLSDALIESLGRKIKILTGGNTPSNVQKKHPLLKLLPKASQEALAYYITEKYKNINRMFRAEALNNEEKYVWLTPLNLDFAHF